ncbi:MAG: amidohydrolase [Bacteroidetes bacterium]|nr:MAG: amidohydrolase [Bacteroidota bacterium]
MKYKWYKLIFLLLLLPFNIFPQQHPDSLYLLVPDRVFDGEQMHENWAIIIQKDTIAQVGLIDNLHILPNTIRISLKGCTVLPGLIEGHSHLFLHPYNETSWNDQVLKESRAERVARATVHAKNELLAGFTTTRDLGTEGAMYDDVGLKRAIEKGIVPGPRMIVVTRAIVAGGSYGPKELSIDLENPKAAADADGEAALTKEVRTQIGKGADMIKVYADYYWGPDNEAQPTFTEQELRKVVEVASSSGRLVAAHSVTVEGMRRATAAGVATIEHGDEGTLEVFRMMKEKGVAFCPTIAASEAVEQYRGWKKGIDPEPAKIKSKRKSFKAALESGVTICMGGDVGVFTHGDNAREMEAMADFGMKPMDILRSATSVNADVFKMSNKIGRIKKGLFADIIAVEGDPSINISAIRNIRLVMKGGVLYKQ